MAHEHHHEHECEHEHACGCCGHEHEHDHDHHDHGEEKFKLPLLIGAAILFTAAFVLHFFDGFFILTTILSIIAVLASGYDVIIDGVKNAVKLRIDETTLMTVAVVAAMILGEFVEAAAVTVLFGFGEYLEDLAVEKSRRDIRKLADIRPDTAVIFEEGATREVPAEVVAVGTILQIAPHARIPLDGVVTDGYGTVDASSLTGESAPVSIEPGSQLMSGMLNGNSAILMQTTKVYADSAATRIVKLVEDSAKNKGDGEKLISRFARIYTPVVVVLAVLIAVIPSLITGDWATWIHRALVCLVASCPCSIVISVPLAYFAGIGAASKIGMLIKGGRFVETLADTYCIAFDKTGTLTENHISVKEIKSLSNYSTEEILELAASVEVHSAHPIAAAIRSYAEEQHISVRELSEYSEVPALGVGAIDGNRIITCGKAKDIDGIAVSVDHEPIGVICLREAIRPEAAQAIRDLHDLGIEGLCLLSGDKDENCRYVAEQVGTNECYSGLLPEDKVEKVRHLKRDYGSCAFVGDGINDAPVLSLADCGIAMGLGSDAAIESADMVLSSENLSTLPRAVKLCRSTIKTVKANIALSLAVKVLVITLAAVGIAPLWLAVLADTGVCLLCVLNAVRLIKKRF